MECWFETRYSMFPYSTYLLTSCSDVFRLKTSSRCYNPSIEAKRKFVMPASR
jgi:hypothetical protein